MLFVASTSLLVAVEKISLQELGQALFFDVNLSKHRNQSCATCHAPDIAFTDPKGNKVSIGSDNISKGTRNTPSISYAALLPAFHRNENGEAIGGFFYDGRASNSSEQIISTLTNPSEMAMSSIKEVISRANENIFFSQYIAQNFGSVDSSNTEKLITVLLDALNEFQNGSQFVKFDSKYDRFLTGQHELTDLEETGRNLFFSDVTNCMQCHYLNTHTSDEKQLFSDHKYHNIGVPKSTDVTKPDFGLADNMKANRTDAMGRFRTPSLRNIAVTGPYMHNGTFKKLGTAIHFYNQHIVDRPSAKLNPETNKPYAKPEIGKNLAVTLLQKGQPLSEKKILALIAFLRTLTDRQYEYLLQ